MTGVPIFFFVSLLRVASSLPEGSPYLFFSFHPSLAFFSFVSTGRGRKRGYKRGKKRNKNRYFESTSAGMSSLPRERERERLAMAIRLYVLRVFEQFSCTEDPVASNPYRESRLHGGERGRGKGEGEGERRRRWRRRPVTKLGRSLGERERSDSCSSLDRTQHPRNVSSFILN